MGAEAKLSRNVRAAAGKVAAGAPPHGQGAPGINHWLLGVLEPYRSVAEKVVPGDWLDLVIADARRQLEAGLNGDPVSPDELLTDAAATASGRGARMAVVRDLVTAVLRRADLDLFREPDGEGSPAGAREDECCAADDGAAACEGTASEARDAAPTPTLDRFGRDLTEQARAGAVHSALDREAETETLIEVLCRTTKRNPLLVGPAGCGKTAVVESLACRVAAGDVPVLLRGVRIVELQVSSLMSGTQFAGSFEERIEKVVEEASQPGLILFIDEAHALVGAGGRTGMADALKPALARGSLALIAATTDDEYRTHVKPDRALERRFQRVPLSELGPASALRILGAHRERLAVARGVRVSDEILEQLVSYADVNLPNRTFPDKALDLLEQCSAYAAVRGQESVSAADVGVVLSRLRGASVSPQAAIVRLGRELAELDVGDEDVDRIARRLGTTLNGLDVKQARPRLVLALSGQAAVQADGIARAFARALYDDEERVLHIDLAPIRDEEAMSLLVGSTPGYVGYGRRLPIHELETTPLTVVVFSGADRCCALAADAVAEGIARGYLADTTGARYFLNDAVVLLPATSTVSSSGGAPFGFAPTTGESSGAKAGSALETLLGGPLAGEVDVHLSLHRGGRGETSSPLAAQQTLATLAGRYARTGTRLTWDDEVAAYLTSARSSLGPAAFERHVEDWVSSLVLAAGPPNDDGEARSVRLSVKRGVGKAETAREQPATPIVTGMDAGGEGDPARSRPSAARRAASLPAPGRRGTARETGRR